MKKDKKNIDNKEVVKEEVKTNKANLYVMIALIVLFIIGIITRWDYISKELKGAYDSYFPSQEQIDSTVNKSEDLKK